MQANQITPDARFFGMFISRSSEGKSTAGASFPKPMLVLDTDLRKGIIGSKHFVDLNGIEVKQFPPSKGFVELERELEGIKLLFDRGQRPYETIQLSSLTTMNRLLVTDATELADKILKKGILRIPGPAEYRYESEACFQIMDYIRGFPCNVIIDAHLVPRWGKPNVANNEFMENIEIGERLSVRDKIAENVLLYFDEVYRFEKENRGNEIKHFVKFRTDIARTVYSQLPAQRLDITGKAFYPEWLKLVKGDSK